MFPATSFGGPYRIEASSMVNDRIITIVLDDVMFGDVWICSGQSNMEFTLKMVMNNTRNYKYVYWIALPVYTELIDVPDITAVYTGIYLDTDIDDIDNSKILIYRHFGILLYDIRFKRYSINTA